MLFYDERLSITNTHSCSSCHEQAHNFAQPMRFSSGVLGVPQQRNAMALANARYNVNDEYFIDQRVGPLEALVLLPIAEPTELCIAQMFHTAEEQVMLGRRRQSFEKCDVARNVVGADRTDNDASSVGQCFGPLIRRLFF